MKRLAFSIVMLMLCGFTYDIDQPMPEPPQNIHRITEYGVCNGHDVSKFIIFKRDRKNLGIKVIDHNGHYVLFVDYVNKVMLTDVNHDGRIDGIVFAGWKALINKCVKLTGV